MIAYTWLLIVCQGLLAVGCGRAAFDDNGPPMPVRILGGVVASAATATAVLLLTYAAGLA